MQGYRFGRNTKKKLGEITIVQSEFQVKPPIGNVTSEIPSVAAAGTKITALAI